MTVRFGRRFALTVRFDSLAEQSPMLPSPPLGADDHELARWSTRPEVDLEHARWAALTLINGGGGPG